MQLTETLLTEKANYNTTENFLNWWLNNPVGRGKFADDLVKDEHKNKRHPLEGSASSAFNLT